MSEITKIIQCFLPTMVAGKYNVQVKQAIVNLKENVDVAIDKTFEFGVDAPRFTLNPSDIYSVYPPSGHFGKYSESLPHVVFTRRTLPWERTIDGKIPECQSGDTTLNKLTQQESPPVPWMALILFNEKDMKDLKIDKSHISDIIQPVPETTQPATGGIIRPRIYREGGQEVLKLMEWEKGKDPENGCFSIDISKEQFEIHIPSKKSLSYLAHAKEVSIKNKDKNGITDLNPGDIGVFSVIVGNKLPDPGQQHTALLVSLEGYADYLSDAPKATKKTFPEGSKVRLVVLANWAFTDSGKATFLELVKGIEVKGMKIQREGEHEKLNHYFRFGYAPLEHLTRNGATTVSWYHGPFLPNQSPKRSKTISFSSSDAALRYDKSTGFFDISFAAAWQLGRMLALQNQVFSRAILNWRINQRQGDVERPRKKIVADILKENGSEDSSQDIPLKNKVINLLAQLNKVNVVTDKKPPLPSTAGNFPKEVTTFLGELYSLKGVPFAYLVPSEYLLEKQHTSFDKQLKDVNTQLQKLKQQNRESDREYTDLKEQQRNLETNSTKYTGTLSLFYVDPNWIEALLDGAMSIGRVQKTEKLFDEVMTGQFSSFFDQKATSLNNPDTADKMDVKLLNITGFLLRTDLVSGWRGVEIEAYDAVGKPLPALRFERIDSDIFLGIFKGNVASVTITQPYEGLHFGFKKEKNFEKNLKNEDGSNKAVTDGTADVNQEINSEFIKDRILNVAGLADVMQKKLKTLGWLKATGASEGIYFTSAEFAYQMIDSPVKYTIEVKMNNS
jgi:hypothetical protein